MARPKTDKNTCRHCRRSAPDVSIRTAKGRPLGECSDCTRKVQLQARLRSRYALGLYQSAPELVAANLKMLATLRPAAYGLYLNTTREQVGYIAIKNGSVYVNIWNDSALFRYALFELASYLGNLNLFLDATPIPILDAENRPLALEDVGKGLELEDVAKRLIWYDSALLERAMELVRDELRQAKRANALIARSNNPYGKAVPKASE